MTEFDVGARLRELREKAGFSQRKLADRSGVPHGMISMVETNRSSPSVASLRKILTGLDVSMADFFERDTSAGASIFFTPHQLTDLTSELFSQTEDGKPKLTFLQVGDAKAHNLQILHETYEAGADTGPTMLDHEASEGGIVVAGEVEITVGDVTQTLKAGDAYMFDSREPHRFRNISDRPAIVISACTPPYI